MPRTIPFKNSNLYFNKVGRDINGNKTITVSFANSRGLSIQTNGNLPITHNLLLGVGSDVDELTVGQMATIETEIMNYIQEFGSPEQKRKLKPDKFLNKGGLLATLSKPIGWSDLNKKI